MLLLLDIDGTLLLGPPLAHRQALLEALTAVYGPELGDEDWAAVQIAGSTDRRILRDLLRHAGLDDEAVDAGLGPWAEAMWGAYAAAEAAHPPPRVAPQARETLLGLRDAGHRLGLLTGNVEPIARAKLAQAGLGEVFAGCPGAFGSDEESRDRLVPVACRRAGPPGAPWPPADTVVIGDTPSDIACARAGGAHAVAVATGRFGPDRLGAADVVLERLADLPAALDRLGGSSTIAS